MANAPDFAKLAGIAARSGVRTSEFWVALVPILLPVADRVGLLHIPDQNHADVAAQIGGIITALFYVYSRTSVKATASSALADLPAPSVPEAPKPDPQPVVCPACKRPLT
jgi:hypothetical protein